MRVGKRGDGGVGGWGSWGDGGVGGMVGRLKRWWGGRRDGGGVKEMVVDGLE